MHILGLLPLKHQINCNIADMRYTHINFKSYATSAAQSKQLASVPFQAYMALKFLIVR